MSIFDDIKSDLENGTPGPWRWRDEDNISLSNVFSAECSQNYGFLDWTTSIDGPNFRFPTMDSTQVDPQANARRIARLPDLERIALAAKELAETLHDCMEETVNYMDINCLGDPEKQHNVKRGRAALKAFREATQ